MAMTFEDAHPVDLHVGAAIRVRRKLLGVSQEVLAEALGLTFQQVQKYERGANRVSASKLWDIANRLDVDVAYFFQGLPAKGEALGETNDAGQLLALLGQKGGVTLSRMYLEMTDDQRLGLLNVARAIVSSTIAQPQDMAA